MGEIRSTLDIIMEKARGIEITEEEKINLQKKELGSRVKGLLQKLIDGLMKLDDIPKEIARLDQRSQDLMKELLKEECLTRLGLNHENNTILMVMEQVLGLNISPIKKLLEQCRSEIEKKKGLREQDMLKKMARMGISGSALIPNLNADPSWKEYLNLRDKQLKREISSAQLVPKNN